MHNHSLIVNNRNNARLAFCIVGIHAVIVCSWHFSRCKDNNYLQYIETLLFCFANFYDNLAV